MLTALRTKNILLLDSNDITSVVQTAVSEVDVIYIPTDNTMANNTETINNIALPAGIPIIAGEEGICSGMVLQRFLSATMISDTQQARCRRLIS